MNLSQTPTLSSAQIDHFFERGFLIVRNWITGDALHKVQESAQNAYRQAQAPLELEAQLGYPGAPADIDDEGGLTPRRLLRAFGRDEEWDAHATSPEIKSCLEALLKHDTIYLSQAHHNCLMTKRPRFSSDTGWHRDSRYWHFEKNELVTAWLALSDEFEHNGCLKVIPGSHRFKLEASEFDTKSFYVPNTPQRKAMLDNAELVELSPGDLLFFHCDLLHAASRNNTNKDKLSLVFTYFNGANAPLADTRSSALPSIKLEE